MERTFLLLIVILIGLGCAVRKNNELQNGSYKNSPIYGVYYSMQLQEDNFKFIWIAGLRRDTIQGKYEKQGNRYWLKPYIPIPQQNIQYQPYYNTSQDLFLYIKDIRTGSCIKGAIVIINGKESYTSNEIGSVIIPREKLQEAITLKVGNVVYYFELDNKVHEDKGGYFIYLTDQRSSRLYEKVFFKQKEKDRLDLFKIPVANRKLVLKK